MLNITDVQLSILKLSSQDIDRDILITRRCQNSHSIIESKLKVQFRNCVARINLWLALTIVVYAEKLSKFISAMSIIYLSLWKIDHSMTQNSQALVILWYMRLERNNLLFNVWTVWDIKHMNMAASFIQRHKLKIKTQGTKNLSASIVQTKCSVIVYNV